MKQPSENFDKVIEKIKKNESELKNAITEMKTTLRVSAADERMKYQ